MGSMNKVQLIGNLGADPEVRTMPSGDLMCNLRLATNESWTDKHGDKQEKTEWHSVTVWGDGLVDVIDKYLRKGSQIFIEGKLETRKWEDKHGEDRYSTEVVVRGFGGQMIMLDGKDSGGGRRDDRDSRRDDRGRDDRRDTRGRDDDRRGGRSGGRDDRRDDRGRDSRRDDRGGRRDERDSRSRDDRGRDDRGRDNRDSRDNNRDDRGRDDRRGRDDDRGNADRGRSDDPGDKWGDQQDDSYVPGWADTPEEEAASNTTPEPEKGKSWAEDLDDDIPF